MKKGIITVIIFFGLMSFTSAQQVSLYDKEGEARAYIDFDKEATIFLWNGTPVAFVEKEGRTLCVFGINGFFLGWYDEGVLYDKKGFPVGARKGAISVITKMERIKGIQQMIPIRPITPITPMQPMWNSNWSSTLLTEFLYFGKKTL